MQFKSVTEYPAATDTVVCYMQYDRTPVFSIPTLQKAFNLYFGDDQMTLSSGDVKCFRLKTTDNYINLILAAFNFDTEKELDDFRKISLKIGTLLNDLKAENIFVDGLMYFSDSIAIAYQLSSTLPLCNYFFDKYKQKKTEYTDKTFFVYYPEYHSDLTNALTEGFNVSTGIYIARDLTNEPSDVLTPEELAKRTIAFGNEYGFEVEVFDKKACEELEMHAFLTVSRGSAYEPRLIVMRYIGDNTKAVSKGVIGKGLCYDSGGLFLKPGASMEHSKADMAGGASVIGAMCAIAMSKLPVNVTCVVAACENMLDGNGYRNGDIVHTMASKSVFVGSTDAEGRLTLADAITYMVRHENVDSIIELSTLTGSCANFFSDVCCGALTTDDALYNKLLKNSDLCGEKYWRIPHFDEFREFIKSDVADLHNTSTNGAGGICAGLFLDEFKEGTPFLHLDVAGMTFSKKKRNGYPSGGTGYGVKTVYHYIKG